MRRKWPKNRGGLLSNPFVVMTDITIALAFILLAIYQQSLHENARERVELQKRKARDFASVVRDHLGGYILERNEIPKKGPFITVRNG